VATLAIVNPVAGKGGGREVWRGLRAAVAEVRGYECVETEDVGHARELARRAAASGYERVIAVGGDGTVFEVANGLAKTPTALAIIPVGTANDTAANLGVPRDAVVAARLAVRGMDTPIDLGEIHQARSNTYFVGVAGFGFDAEVAWRVNHANVHWARSLGGTGPYLSAVLQCLLQYRSSRIRISIDERVVDRRMFLVAIANTPSYGGGMRIAPEAVPYDGLLDVCLVADVRRLDVLRLLPRMYSGAHVSHRAVQVVRCRELSADADQRVRCHADGEPVGELPVRFGIAPGGLRCVTGVASARTTT
jgi:diacylglycerol kinase (ATP)